MNPNQSKETEKMTQRERYIIIREINKKDSSVGSKYQDAYREEVVILGVIVVEAENKGSQRRYILRLRMEKVSNHCSDELVTKI